MIPYDVAEWGQRVHMSDGTYGTFNADKWMLHWPGSAYSNSPSVAFRNIEDYHIDHRGWKTIAYNYGIAPAGTIFRLRGENQSGATSGDLERDGIPENKEARAVIFLTNGAPTAAQKNAFRRMWFADPLPVFGHKQVRELSGTGTITQCPGQGMMDFINGTSWTVGNVPPSDTLGEDDMATTSNPAFQASFDKALAAGVFTSFTAPTSQVTAEKLAVFLDRAGVFDADVVTDHNHTGTFTTD